MPATQTPARPNIASFQDFIAVYPPKHQFRLLISKSVDHKQLFKALRQKVRG
jgi:hypothetical protein